MKPVAFDDAETYEPEDGWRRVSMAGSDQFSFEWFEKPPGHSSPMHDHENEQVCLCLEGELTVATEDDSVTLQKNDSVLLESNETHRVENTGDELAVGLDVFAPGARSTSGRTAKSERTMKYLARTATGDPLLGDDEGYVPPSAPSNPIWGASGKHSRAPPQARSAMSPTRPPTPSRRPTSRSARRSNRSGSSGESD